MLFDITKKTIGIIGYGKFGEIICNNLFPHSLILVYSPHLQDKILPSHCLAKNSLEDVITQADVIIPSVPIRAFEAVIHDIAPVIKAQQMIIDICSVKEYSVTILKKYLPSTIYSIATHPLFGPTSITRREGVLSGLPLVMFNISAPVLIYDGITSYFQSLGLQITELEPVEHDRLIAQSQFFAQMVRYLSVEQKLNPTIIDTPAPSYLFQALTYMGISKDLLIDMITYNPFSQRILQQSIEILTSLRLEALD